MINDTCPISRDPAKAVLSTSDYYEFDCPNCGRFRISELALEHIAELSRQEREALLSQARSDAQGGDGIPLIRNIYS